MEAHPLRAAMAAADITQTELARRLCLEGISVHQTAISQYSLGKVTPPARVAKAIERILGVPGLAAEMRLWERPGVGARAA